MEYPGLVRDYRDVRRLSAKHQALIAGSAISDDVAAERGYRTVTTAEELTALGFADYQARLVPALLVPIYGPDKTVVLYQTRPDKPRTKPDGPAESGGTKPVKYETPAGARLRLDCPPRIAGDLNAPAVPLWITEGVRKADAAVSAGLCCVCLMGVDAWQGSDDNGETGPVADWKAVTLDDRDVYIAYDSDVMTKESVQGARQRLTLFLAGRGARAHWIYLPPGKKDVNGQAKKVGLDDYLAEGRSADDVYALARSPGRATIRANGRSLPDITREAVAALSLANTPPVVFQRLGVLVEARETGVTALEKDRLRYRLSETADWVKVLKGGGQVPVTPNADVVANVKVASNLWPYPRLDRIVTTPVFAKDGSLRSTPGYHRPSRSLYVPPEELQVPPVPDVPGKKNVRRAREVIEDLFCDFAFVDQADRAHAWALLLQPFAREMILGPTPLYGVEAPKQGTGKTLLVQTALAPAIGEVAQFTEPHGDEEMEKRLTSAFLNAAQAVLFDNVTRTINWPSLASALTASQWQGRVLGESQTVRAPVLCTWAVTANNPQYSDDMARRVVRIRLDARVQDPHRRSDFKHSLPAYALANRSRLIWAACTLIRSWVAAGRPAPADDVPKLASYGPWRRVMGGILGHVGVPGLLGNLFADDSADEKPPEQEALEAILDYVMGRRSGGIFRATDLVPHIEGDPDLASAILPGTREPLGGRIGKFLRQHKGQLVNGHRLERSSKRRSGGFTWVFTALETDDV